MRKAGIGKQAGLGVVLNPETQARKPQTVRGSHGENSFDEPASGSPSARGSELLAALTGRDANRDRMLAHRTRNVVQSSLGLLREQEQDRARTRSVALAVTLLVLLLIAPLLWESIDSLIAGEHLGDPGSQMSLWACLVCSTLLGAAFVAGWWRRRS
jgi:hypothetical protein